ncbi:RILP-like protein homolog [Oppia nitens]|uniref:RILP-like protein homolog n=1 Tax=Oppia nitens TaxID=1686743 RepID=UPI0023DB2654|nr:RILP-like protein homolog [Oppia nitens]
MDRKSGDIEVEDVYDLAAEIGDQFQKVIDNCGSDSIKHLMPKVIRVLEHLEMMAIVKEDYDSKLDQLKHSIFELENDKRVKAVSLNKYELEMESIEENWRKENLHLTQCVSQLRQQNLKLSNRLIDSQQTLSQSLTDLQKRGQQEIDLEIVSLKESIKRSESKVDAITKEMDEKNEEIEKLTEQIEEVMQQNRDLRRRMKHNKYQLLHMNEAKADPNYKDLIGLSEHILVTNSDDCDLFNDHKPFTLNELRNIILEVNYLRKHSKELEEEIKVFKKPIEIKPLIDEINDIDNNTCNDVNSGNSDSLNSNLSDDLPVEGPINREPEDKLYPRRRSSQNRILRFFPTINWNRLKKSAN